MNIAYGISNHVYIILYIILNNSFFFTKAQVYEDTSVIL